jgi:DNA-directed RNA polymerase subunit alpha
MAQILEVDVKQLVLAGGPFGPQEIKQIVNAVAEDSSQYRAFRDAVGELEMREDRSPAAAVRFGVCFYLLGRYSMAIQTLKSSASYTSHSFISTRTKPCRQPSRSTSPASAIDS